MGDGEHNVSPGVDLKCIPKYRYNGTVPSRIWGPGIVVGVFVLAGGLIGGDLALWPWDERISFKLPIVVGSINGLLIGAFIAWVVGQLEDLG